MLCLQVAQNQSHHCSHHRHAHLWQLRLRAALVPRTHGRARSDLHRAAAGGHEGQASGQREEDQDPSHWETGDNGTRREIVGVQTALRRMRWYAEKSLDRVTKQVPPSVVRAKAELLINKLACKLSSHFLVKA